MIRRISRVLAAGAFLVLGSCTGEEPPDPVPEGCVDTANPVKVGGIFTLSFGPSVELEHAAARQMYVFASEVNNACGILGTPERGRAMAVIAKDGQDQPSVARSLMPGFLETEKVAFMIGAGGSEPSIPAADRAVDNDTPFGVFFALSDALSGCTSDQLADPKVARESSPVYEKSRLRCWKHDGLSLRAGGTATQLARVAADWIRGPDSGLKDVKTAAVIGRYDGLGIPASDGFVEAFSNGNRTVTSRIIYTPNTGKDVFKQKIQELVQGDPELIVGIWRVGELKAFMQAWVELDQQPDFVKPSHWDTLRFVHLGTLNDQYADTGAKAVTILSERAVVISAAHNPESEGFARWVALNRSYDPDFAFSTHTEAKAYDMLMILSLAMAKAGTTDGPAIAAQIDAITNPPGQKYYPGQFQQARDALLRGEDIDYECAFGDCDFDEHTREPLVVPYSISAISREGVLEPPRNVLWQDR